MNKYKEQLEIKLDELFQKLKEKNLLITDPDEKILEDINNKYNIENETVMNWVKYNEFTVNEKLEKLEYYKIQFKEYYYKESNLLEKLEEIYENIKGEIFDYYKFNFEKELKTTEIEKYYLPNNKYLVTLNNSIKKQRFIVNILKNYCTSLESLNWNIKNYKDILKLY